MQFKNTVKSHPNARCFVSDKHPPFLSIVAANVRPCLLFTLTFGKAIHTAGKAHDKYTTLKSHTHVYRVKWRNFPLFFVTWGEIEILHNSSHTLSADNRPIRWQLSTPLAACMVREVIGSLNASAPRGEKVGLGWKLGESDFFPPDEITAFGQVVSHKFWVQGPKCTCTGCCANALIAPAVRFTPNTKFIYCTLLYVTATTSRKQLLNDKLINLFLIIVIISSTVVSKLESRRLQVLLELCLQQQFTHLNWSNTFCNRFADHRPIYILINLLYM